MAGLSRVLVTGGAGFIGSHLVDRLMRSGAFVRVADNLSSGSMNSVKEWSENPLFEFVRCDLKDPSAVDKAVDGIEAVFHLAANPEVRVAEVDPSIHFRENLLTTFNVLEGMRKSKSAKLVVFFSSSTVYGEPLELPTTEEYGPLLPISVYGASKLGCEALVNSYCRTFGLVGFTFRLANIVGSRSKHGVVVDFVRKLRQNPGELEILGDGTQSKSYLHVQDLVNAILHVLNTCARKTGSIEVYNVGSLDRVDVERIARIVSEEMGISNLKFKFTGGVDGGRGWKSDVKNMQLSIDKLKGTGWNPSLGSEEAIRKSCRELLDST